MEPTALITGGSRGIGLGIAEALAKKGFNIAINGVRPEEKVSQVLEQLREFDIKVIYCQGNIAETEDRANILGKVKQEFGYLNLLVNNAGVAPKLRNDILYTTEDSYDYVMDINLKGVYFLTQSVANWMVLLKEENPEFKASIITISSISATVASVNRGEYCLSKAGLAMLTQLFASRLGEFDIPVFEVRPGVIQTDMTAGVKAKYDKMFEEGLSIQARWGLPEDIGKTVAAIATGAFPYSTGQVFMVDGGMTIQRL
ncbi:3-ketoacyl-ACP reductase [Chondrinema litorale]|uniref:3-ketoacyl-ACP reductase n=1 Tax=Chondrinema litorale TaxID=2994555 RepID=UPI002543AB85|nr:3-ketoacyl-ACP reductase [Chondrinema litorale]UZR98741.1 3-ketoacyl-ACP reductase [Chondrinema litorale]